MASKRSTRKLDPLPGHDAGTADLRAWLTAALGFPPGWTVWAFERAGSRLTDPATLIVHTAEGTLGEYRFAQQRDLATSGRLRAAMFMECGAVCRLPALTKTELEDVWGVLCMLGRVIAEQDDRDVTLEWLEGLVSLADPVNGISLEDPAARFDAIQYLKARPTFDRLSAALLHDPNVDPRRVVKPALVVDSAGPYWIRPGELAAYVHHVIGAVEGSGSLTARVGELGVTRHVFEVRRGDRHPKLVVYRLPAELEPELIPSSDPVLGV